MEEAVYPQTSGSTEVITSSYIVLASELLQLPGKDKEPKLARHQGYRGQVGYTSSGGTSCTLFMSPESVWKGCGLPSKTIQLRTASRVGQS